MTLAQWVTLVAALGGPAGILSVIFLVPQIRKLQADTAKVERDTDLADIDGAATLSAAALAQMTAALDRAAHAETEAASARSELREVSHRLDGMEEELRAYREAAQDHVAWDMLRIQELESFGATPPEAPPLLPPGSRRNRH